MSELRLSMDLNFCPRCNGSLYSCFRLKNNFGQMQYNTKNSTFTLSGFNSILGDFGCLYCGQKLFRTFCLNCQ